MTLTSWQRTNLLGAVNYLRDLGRLNGDNRAELLAVGLLEVLDPSRRTVRLQREAAQATTASAQAGKERRGARDRRATVRGQQPAPHTGPERRSGRDRRGGDRRG